MRRPRFFTAQTLLAGRRIELEKEPSRHIAKARRLRAGDALCVFDGQGREALARVVDIAGDTVAVHIHSVASVSCESPLAITLAIALSRGERMDTIVQKASELGVCRIQPLISERTVLRLDSARLARKREHWQKIAISACEQCGRNQIPRIDAAAPLAEVLHSARSSTALRLVLHPSPARTALPPRCAALWLLIGPEGGFSDSEISAALEAGFRHHTLGPRVLRTETAPLAAIAIAQARWGDL